MNWKKSTIEFIRATNEYIEDVVQYCELKEKGGWFDSLSDAEMYTMNRIKEKFGDVNIPAKDVRVILVDITDRLKRTFDRTLSELEDALHDLPWKIERMKQQQENLSDQGIQKILMNINKDWKEEFRQAQKATTRNPWKEILRHVSDFLQSTFVYTFNTVWSILKT